METETGTGEDSGTGMGAGAGTGSLPTGGAENEVAFTVYANPDAAPQIWAEIESMNGVIKVGRVMLKPVINI
jgi:hypothetical protein